MRKQIHARGPIDSLRLAALCALCAAAPALGQREECRKPTQAESRATEKMTSAVKSTLEATIEGLGWKLRGRESDGMPLSIGTDANPPRPLGSCWPLYAATFEMTDANPRSAALHAQADKGLQVETAWMGACLKTMKGCDAKPPEAKAGERATAAFTFEIRAGENTPYMRGPHDRPIGRIDAAGAAVAYTYSDRDEYMRNTTLCFGPFKPETVFSADKSQVLFPFRHPKESPFIENLCVNIRSTPETADEIVRKVDWKPLNAALTP